MKHDTNHSYSPQLIHHAFSCMLLMLLLLQSLARMALVLESVAPAKITRLLCALLDTRQVCALGTTTGSAACPVMTPVKTMRTRGTSPMVHVKQTEEFASSTQTTVLGKSVGRSIRLPLPNLIKGSRISGGPDILG